MMNNPIYESRRKYTYLCLIVSICLLISGCRVTKPYSTIEFSKFKLEMIKEYESLQVLSIEIASFGDLSVYCKMRSEATRTETQKVYHEVVDFFTREDVLTEYFRKQGTGYDSTPPPEPYISRESGPSISLDFYYGEQRVYQTIEFTRYESNTENGGVYVYDGSWEWPIPLEFHRENLTLERAGELTGETASADFDGDGDVETAAVSENSLMMQDGGKLRLLDNAALTGLIMQYSAIKLDDADDSYVYIPYNEGLSVDWERYFEPDGSAHELELSLVLSGFSVTGTELAASFDAAINDKATGGTQSLGTVQIPVFYDDELGFRAGEF
jgi:hypothetical protein